MPPSSLADAQVADWSPEVEGFILASGLLAWVDRENLRPLTGGVSSKIWLVEQGDARFVVKTPLERLNVAQEWTAPVERGVSEADWLRTASRLVPGVCPRVLAHDPRNQLLALEYLDPQQFMLWKAQLMAGRVNCGVAVELGGRLASIHRLAAGEPALAGRFAHDDLFTALRINPYLTSLETHHPDLADPIRALADRTLGTHQTLTHGDVSPKNILVGPAGPVLLDAETARWGDPAFDVAFCVNHLLLKGLLPTVSASELCIAARALMSAYLCGVGDTFGSDLEARVVALLPALLLARVDGRSPVEYLHSSAQQIVRDFGRAWLGRDADLAELTAAWEVAAS